MSGKTASELGFTVTQVVGYYNLIEYGVYNELCSAANASHIALHQAGQGLLGNIYTDIAGKSLIAQAQQAKLLADQTCAEHYVNYQLKMSKIAQHWDSSKICAIKNGKEFRYFQVPYSAVVHYIENGISISFMGKTYPIVEVDYDTALTVVLKSQWEMVESQVKVISQDEVQTTTQNRGSRPLPDEDGDVVYGDTYLDNKFVIGGVKGNIIQGNKYVQKETPPVTQGEINANDVIMGKTIIGDKVVGDAFGPEFDAAFGDNMWDD
jgi:hypothetical protein